jgi:hypothetical protein
MFYPYPTLPIAIPGVDAPRRCSSRLAPLLRPSRTDPAPPVAPHGFHGGAASGSAAGSRGDGSALQGRLHLSESSDTAGVLLLPKDRRSSPPPASIRNRPAQIEVGGAPRPAQIESSPSRIDPTSGSIPTESRGRVEERERGRRGRRPEGGGLAWSEAGDGSDEADRSGRKRASAGGRRQ